MSQEARWVCHTCKTVCPRGGRPIFRNVTGTYTAQSINYFKDMLQRFNIIFEFDNYERYKSFLDDLKKWLERHEIHNIHIGSDYSTDMMDLDDYRNETVDGTVSKLTRMEAQLASLGEWEESAIQEIEKALVNYADNKDSLSPRAIAEDLHRKFSAREL